ncbi:MAG: 1-acyl-sn-glycerol-3-phosphate acyltransferase [Clostridia bacterium]|nr:1-acyl-sn-glycerol-3-phosphate acyltransferase [Clostridia bacterium]
MYSVFKFIIKIFCKLIFFVEVKGEENVPKEGAAILAINHISFWDAPIILAFSKRRMRTMGKAELFDHKLLAPFLRMAGAFPVHRGTSDITAIKTALKTLKDGEIFTIFPTGTRVKDGEYADAKAGVALIASKSGAPVVPIAIRGGYRLFKKVTIHIGTPLYVKGENGVKPSGDELKIYADNILSKINSLGA